MGILGVFRTSSKSRIGEINYAPSMTEDAHLLSIEQIVKDYSRGILHPEFNHSAVYDDGEEISNVQNYDDLTDLFPNGVNSIYHLQDREPSSEPQKMNDSAPESETNIETKNE
ncbi:hypothetical protein [Capybara microvirus Cap3_SP_612]|nr:hypothetical protein [Capybara microvirus Cap3_SP_612]